MTCYSVLLILFFLERETFFLFFLVSDKTFFSLVDKRDKTVAVKSSTSFTNDLENSSVS